MRNGFRQRWTARSLAAFAALFLLLLNALAPLARAETAARLSFIDQTGQPLSTDAFLGRPSVLVFGFTSCPSICPTLLTDVAARMADMGPLADQMNFIFVSVDPEHDTPEILRDYLAYFDKRIVGLTGDVSAITALAKSVGAKFQKVPFEGGGYTVDHSVMAFLMDREWQRKGILLLGAGTDEKRAGERLRAMLADAGG
jgi:protein SCO1/2